jgi:hypothetical protein
MIGLGISIPFVLGVFGASSQQILNAPGFALQFSQVAC